MHYRENICALIVAIALAATVSSPHAQQGPSNEPDRTIGAAERAEVIEGALKHLDEAYIFADVSKKMREAVTARVSRKEYEHITSAKTLATTLTTHLQEVSKDKH